MEIKTLAQERGLWALRFLQRALLIAEGKYFEMGDPKRIISFLPEEEPESDGELEKAISQFPIGKEFLRSSYRKAKEEAKGENWYSRWRENVLKSFPEDYISSAKRLPQLIVTNGLIPTVAFYRSKNLARQQMINDLQEWLKHRGLINEDEDLLEVLAKVSSAELMMLTNESLAFAEWLKRMAEVKEKEWEEKKRGEGGE